MFSPLDRYFNAVLDFVRVLHEHGFSAERDDIGEAVVQNEEVRRFAHEVSMSSEDLSIAERILAGDAAEFPWQDGVELDLF